MGLKEDDMVWARITLMKKNADDNLKKKRQDVSVPETVSGSFNRDYKFTDLRKQKLVAGNFHGTAAGNLLDGPPPGDMIDMKDSEDESEDNSEEEGEDNTEKESEENNEEESEEENEEESEDREENDEEESEEENEEENEDREDGGDNEEEAGDKIREVSDKEAAEIDSEDSNAVGDTIEETVKAGSMIKEVSDKEADKSLKRKKSQPAEEVPKKKAREAENGDSTEDTTLGDLDDTNKAEEEDSEDDSDDSGKEEGGTNSSDRRELGMSLEVSVSSDVNGQAPAPGIITEPLASGRGQKTPAPVVLDQPLPMSAQLTMYRHYQYLQFYR